MYHRMYIHIEIVLNVDSVIIYDGQITSCNYAT